MALDKTLANNIRMSQLDAEIRQTMAELDEAMADGRRAKMRVDLATQKLRLTALRVAGIIQEDDGFSDEEPEGIEPHGQD